MLNTELALPMDKLETFCCKWQVKELWLFGSATRDDFSPESDLDFLVQFMPESDWSLFDHAEMEIEMETILGRSVDLVSRLGIEMSKNHIRRDAILGNAQSIYHAA